MEEVLYQWQKLLLPVTRNTDSSFVSLALVIDVCARTGNQRKPIPPSFITRLVQFKDQNTICFQIQYPLCLSVCLSLSLSLSFSVSVSVSLSLSLCLCLCLCLSLSLSLSLCLCLCLCLFSFYLIYSKFPSLFILHSLPSVLCKLIYLPMKMYVFLMFLSLSP